MGEIQINLSSTNLINKTIACPFLSQRSILKQTLTYHLTRFQKVLTKGVSRNSKHQLNKKGCKEICLINLEKLNLYELHKKELSKISTTS